jgi:hypothetical protein
MGTTAATKGAAMKQQVIKAHELKVGDLARPVGLTGDYDFDTVFEVEISERNIFGVIDIQVMVGMTDKDIYVGCTPNTCWEVK